MIANCTTQADGPRFVVYLNGQAVYSTSNRSAAEDFAGQAVERREVESNEDPSP